MLCSEYFVTSNGFCRGAVPRADFNDLALRQDWYVVVRAVAGAASWDEKLC